MRSRKKLRLKNDFMLSMHGLPIAFLTHMVGISYTFLLPV